MSPLSENDGTQVGSNFFRKFFAARVSGSQRLRKTALIESGGYGNDVVGDNDVSSRQ